jgi:hypothetical protein
MIAKKMVLQNHTNTAMELQDRCGEPNPTSRDASQAINIKVGEASDAEEEVGPVPITFPELKAEPEVRCMSLCVHCESYCCTRPWRPIGLQDLENCTFCRQSTHIWW